jgi:hypothetical protein
MLARASGAFRRHAVAAASATLSLKYGLADAMTQHAQNTGDGAQPLNGTRSALFFAFGALYGELRASPRHS